MKRSAVGLFAGIGGLEVGLEANGWRTELFCEIDEPARAVLAAHWPDVPQVADVAALRSLPAGVELVTAGFPCQDLSQAGGTAGITGSRSGLVEHVFRLISRRNGPRWLLLENVPFMLHLDSGSAMRFLTQELERLGYRWAYRVVDARAFGLPQRRQRVVMLASRTDDPRPVLFGDDVVPPVDDDPDLVACGFYWTEGTRGLGWAVDAVPTLKGGSTIGIPSPPAIRLPTTRQIVTPGIVDAERLQGFDPDWTQPALTLDRVRPGHRWKLVGNAVNTRMSEWVANQLDNTGLYDPSLDTPLPTGSTWPNAAWGEAGRVHRVMVGQWPTEAPYEHLEQFVETPKPLSARATKGFLSRARASSLRFADGFLDDVADHLDVMGGFPRVAA